MKREVLMAMCIGPLLTGCSFRAPQVEGIMEAFRNGKNQVDEELAEQAWSLEWLTDRAIVYPVIIDEYIVFTNRSDVQVVFDGWQVIAASQLLPGGRRATIEVSADRTQLRFIENDLVVLDTQCEPWSKIPDADAAALWLQSCRDLDEPNLIRVGVDGQTNELRFSVHPSYPPVRLSKGIDSSS